MMDSKFKLERLVVCTSCAMFLPLLYQPVCLFAWCCWSFLSKENPFSQLSPSVVQNSMQGSPAQLKYMGVEFPHVRRGFGAAPGLSQAKETMELKTAQPGRHVRPAFPHLQVPLRFDRSDLT